VDDEHQAALDRTNGPKPVFVGGMRVVEDHEVVDARCEELGRFFEGNAVLLLVGRVRGPT